MKSKGLDPNYPQDNNDSAKLDQAKTLKPSFRPLFGVKRPSLKPSKSLSRVKSIKPVTTVK